MFVFSTRLHAIIDYAFSFFLMLAPAIFGFGEADWETIVPIAAGMTICFYSFFTNYEGGLYLKFSMKTHNLFDLIIGAVIATSPWVFGFRDIVYKPHLAIGIGFSLVALLGLWPIVKLHKVHLHWPVVDRIRFN